MWLCFAQHLPQMFENPTSAPWIAPIVTISPLPPLFHLRTFYIARYTSSTTHPPQPTYTFNKLKQKEGKKEKKRKEKKNSKFSNNNNHNNQITIPISKSTADIHMHHFYTLFMCQRSIAGVPLDSDGRIQASLLLRTTCMRSCCSWIASCVVA